MPSESPIVAAVSRLAELPGIPEQVEAAREACTRLRWHQALRKRIPEAAAESRVRGAHASGELEGASVPVDVLRDVVRGAATWSPDPDPVELTMRGVLAATAETEHLAGIVLTAPLQALARLHTAAAAGLVADGALGRPRRPGEESPELTDLGAAPPAQDVAVRLRDVADVLVAVPSLPVVVAAAVVHAELATVRPFVRGNAVVARAGSVSAVCAAVAPVIRPGWPSSKAVMRQVGERPTSGRSPPTAEGMPSVWGCGSRTVVRRCARRPPRARRSPMRCWRGAWARPPERRDRAESGWGRGISVARALP